VLVIAPTRELAQQLGRELTWLYEPLNARVVAVTGGTNPLEERRGLSG
jgi:ATP-dependent RNA helicase DeaD